MMADSLFTLFANNINIRNLPQQSSNAEAFAEAYLHFTVFALAIKMLRQLNS